MKILFLTPVYPWPLDTGWAQRFHHVGRTLALGHEVTLMAVCQDDDARSAAGSPLDELCAEVIRVDVPEPDRGATGRIAGLVSGFPKEVRSRFSAGVVRHLRRLAREDRFDVVWAGRIALAEMARRAGFKRVIVDVDDIPSVLARRKIRTEPWRMATVADGLDLVKLQFYERALGRRFWRVVVSKEADLPTDPVARRKTFVVPNGVLAGRVTPDREAAAELLFVGHLFHEPNVDAIAHFRSEILPKVRGPLPGARFVIVGKGRNPSVLALDDGDGTRVAVSVPDLDPYYESAAVVVAPIRQGSGTRVKVLEALARGKAVVATTIGAEGLGLRSGVDLEIADGPERFAEACVRLLNDPARRRQLGASGRERVLATRSWDSIEDSIARVLAE